MIVDEKILKNLKKSLYEKRNELSKLTEDLEKFENDYKNLILLKEQKLISLEREIQTITNGTKFISIEFNNSASDSNEFLYKKNTPSSEETKILYKKLVKKIHPDLYSNEFDKIEKNKILIEVNKAYSENNYSTLLEIWNDIDDSISIEFKLKFLEEELNAIKQKLVSIKSSNIFKLKIKSDILSLKGINYIEDISKNLDVKIELAWKKLCDLRDTNILNKY